MNLKNSDYRYFCWSLASYFTNNLMIKLNIPLIYIDGKGDQKLPEEIYALCIEYKRDLKIC